MFCIDKNFNKQAFLSIASFYKTNIYFKNKIYIIHKSPNSFKKYLEKIENFFPDNNVEVIKFKFKIKHYPNLKSSHVSEATYYRMFIADHISDSSPFVVYVDADAFFLEDINEDIYKIANKLSSENILLSAKTEHTNDEAKELFKRLDMDSRYFNAGVMIINFQKWKNENVSEKLRNKVDEIKENINYWDQDVLNKYFDTNIEILDHRLNCKIDDDSPRVNLQSDPYILHYAGSKKPWTIEGLTDIDSHYFQNNYLLANNKKFYYMSTNWRLGTLKLLLKKICTFSIFNSKNYIKIIVSSLLLLTRRRVK